MDKECLFCKIIKREFGSDVVYENDFVLAFKDIHPVAPVHILIVPKVHISNSNEIDDENANYIAEVWKAIKEVAKITGIKETGYRVICNCGDDGAQVIHHIHYHLLGGKHLGPKLVKE